MRKSIMAIALLAACAVWQTPADAAVKLHGLFSDNMVLQRDMHAPIWGTADPGEDVVVQIFTKPDSKEPAVNLLTRADKDGKWQIVLAPMPAGGPYTVTVKSKNNQIDLKNVLLGEVWIASGQSNMEWELSKTRDPKDVIANSKNAKIRLFDVPKTPSQTPQRDLGTAKGGGKGRTFGRWMESSPESVANFSAVGYYFGRKLEKDLNVPVAIINCSWGGVAAERYTAKSVLDNMPELKGGKGARSDLYNGMIVPLQPFAMRGVIWYQGESNAGQAKQYFHLMNAMIKSWRDDWKQGDFPFLTVQLAPYEKGNYAEIRESQLMTSLKVKNTAMAVITDAGDRNNIHPPDKLPVGERLALAAEAIAYKQKVEYTGPLYDSMKVEGDKVVLSFKNTPGGLVAKGGALTGFTIAGKDGKFVKGEATIVNNTVHVRSPEVPQPAAVRYGWANYPVVNLYSKDGLPASPFRTDLPDYYK
jgi:sialate O-acetylesterase